MTEVFQGRNLAQKIHRHVSETTLNAHDAYKGKVQRRRANHNAPFEVYTRPRSKCCFLSMVLFEGLIQLNEQFVIVNKGRC